MIVTVTPNIFAFIALILWVPVVAILFLRLRPALALSISAFGGLLLLPELVELFDLPALPPMDKRLIVPLGLLIGVLASSSRQRVLSTSWRGLLLLGALLAASNLATVLTNGDDLIYGPTRVQAMQFNDAISMTVRDLIEIAVPFFAARALIRSRRNVHDLLMVLIAAAVLYIPLILVELRLSPQLHNWVYGFAQHAFLQTRRGGGWRPMVFMAHGLDLAAFLASALLAAVALSKLRLQILRVGAKVWAGVLAVVLVLSKSMAAMLYGIGSLPVVLFSKGRLAMAVAVALSAIALTFPWLRETGVFPTERFVAAVTPYSQERAASLAFRFDNEDQLIEKAQERFLFGWGTYGRPRTYDEDGRSRIIVDGWWIIKVGEAGVVGFLILFGLLIYPIVIAAWKFRRLTIDHDKIVVGTLSLLVALRVIELLPNGLFSFLPFFFAGALAGIVSASDERRARRAGTAATRAAAEEHHEAGRVRRPRRRTDAPA